MFGVECLDDDANSGVLENFSSALILCEMPDETPTFLNRGIGDSGLSDLRDGETETDRRLLGGLRGGERVLEQFC